MCTLFHNKVQFRKHDFYSAITELMEEIFLMSKERKFLSHGTGEANVFTAKNFILNIYVGMSEVPKYSLLNAMYEEATCLPT